ncbi:MAG TPA: type 1 glutamine amidotransferase [Gaiellaceae bacterium]|jgi:GMP synthase-like glutamine amidotransferase|nr:type 1 glutamine amidotransferase [Gaiellaceae bacterium]
MRVLAVTHGPLVGPELFGDVILDTGHELIEWEIATHGSPPRDGYGAVLVLGGDQNVGEEVRYPWLHDEYAALRRWLDNGTPLLGICLGAQTLGHVLGADVAALADGRLAGFYETTLTAAGAEDPVTGGLPPTFAALNANAYGFTLPPGTVELARGPVVQAYRAGACAWGVQFHPEVRRDQVLEWFSEDEPDLPRPLPELVQEVDAGLAEWQEHGRRLCRAFLAAADPTE